MNMSAVDTGLANQYTSTATKDEPALFAEYRTPKSWIPGFEHPLGSSAPTSLVFE